MEEEIREDIQRAVCMNQRIDQLWTTEADRATALPAAVYSKPVILPRWEES